MFLISPIASISFIIKYLPIFKSVNLKLFFMSESTKKTGISFLIIGIVALVWNLMGVMAYLDQAYMTEEELLAKSVAEQALYADLPAWVTGAFAISVFGGTLACILLLLKKKLASFLFVISFIAIVAQMSYNFFVSNAAEVFGVGDMIISGLVLVIGAFLVWYSRKQEKEGVLT